MPTAAETPASTVHHGFWPRLTFNSENASTSRYGPARLSIRNVMRGVTSIRKFAPAWASIDAGKLSEALRCVR